VSPRKIAVDPVRADGSPVRLTRRNHGRGHSYRIDDVKVPGVTTILNALPKQLTKWAAEKGADHAVNHWDELAALPLSERHKRIMWAHREDVTGQAIRGNRVHALGEKLAHGEEVRVPDDLRGPVEAYARFLDRWEIQVYATETPIGSPRYRYAGTADAWCSIGKLGVESALLDLKSGRGVYDEVALQLAGYRFAELWQPDGPASEEPLPEVEDCFVAHIGPDDVRLLPVEVTSSLFRGFLYVFEVSKLLERMRDERPVSEALILEDFS
jgi:hypothetical protein